MNTAKENQNKPSPKIKMTGLMRGLILILSLIGIVSIVYLILVNRRITDNYTKISNEIYLDVEYMNTLNQSLYNHQTLVFEHIIASAGEKKSSIESEAAVLTENMREYLTLFGETTTGSKYEIYFHNIYSGIVGYLKNVDIIFDFSRNGDVETAQYYMENILEDYLDKVNENVKTMDEITKQDMQSAKLSMDRNTSFVRVVSFVLLAILIVFAVVAQILGYHVSDIMANYDAETGAINYAHFIECVEKQQKLHSASGYVMLAINIKGFQYINQRIGIENGKQLLREYVKRIKSQIGKNDIVARSSGDSFLVYMQQSRLEEFLAFLRNVMIEVVPDAKDNAVEGMTKLNIAVPSRCGYYTMADGITCHKALDNAELALKLTKDMAETDQLAYVESMHDEENARTQIIHEFKPSLDNKEFLVYYQPVVDVDKRVLCGAEALVRWFHDNQMISPAHFIPVLEREGFIIELDFWVLDTVCKAIRYWTKEGYTLVPVSVNFSMLHLRDENLANRIVSVIDSYQIDHRYIEIELNPSTEFEGTETLRVFVNQMKENGVAVYLDDFGAEYSSLTMMKHLDVDAVKLDKEFISDIADDEQDIDCEKFVSNVVQMVKDMNKKVVLVGVETLKQSDFLKNIQCYQLQGFLFDRPLPPEEFANRLNRPNY